MNLENDCTICLTAFVFWLNLTTPIEFLLKTLKEQPVKKPRCFSSGDRYKEG